MQDQMIVAVFPSRDVLLNALDYLMEEAAADVRQAAVIAKSKTGDILILDDTLGSGEGALIGGAVGAGLLAIGAAMLGAWALPAWNVVLVASVGLLLGGLAGWMAGQLAARGVRHRFVTEQVEALGDRLQDGHTALVLQARDAAKLLPRLKHNLKQAELVEKLLDLR